MPFLPAFVTLLTVLLAVPFALSIYFSPTTIDEQAYRFLECRIGSHAGVVVVKYRIGIGYEQRRQLLFEFAVRNGFWSGPPGNVM